MKPLNFPNYDFKFRRTGEVTSIWDNIRRRYVILTPEEWVRVHLVRYLIEEKSYPAGLMAVEKGLKLNGLFRRADVVVFGKNARPILLAECKAPFVELSQRAFDQAARYNIVLKVPLLIVTNGLDHFCCLIDTENGTYQFISEIPPYDDVI